MPRFIAPSSFECDCGHALHFFENTIREMREASRRKRSSLGEGDDPHSVIFDKGEWVAIYCPKVRKAIPASVEGEGGERGMKGFTQRQGQVLAYIHLYWKLNRRGPSEAEIARYFAVTAATAHGMVVTLDKAGWISREAGAARSIRVLVDAGELPELEGG